MGKRFRSDDHCDDDRRELFRGPGGPFTKHLMLAVFAATVGSSFQYGYMLSSILSPAEVVVDLAMEGSGTLTGRNQMAHEQNQWNLVVVLYAFGGLLGSLMCGSPIDRFGRKSVILISNIFTFMGLLFLSSVTFIDDYSCITFGCLIVGFSCGLTSCVVPVYLHEIAPESLRGTVCTFHHFMVAFGIFVAQVLSLKSVLGNKRFWPCIYVLCFLPMILQLHYLPKCPESPKYNLIIRNFVDQTERDLCKLRDVNSALPEIFNLRGETLMVAASDRVTLWNLFRANTRWPAVSAIVVVLVQPLSGSCMALFSDRKRFGLDGFRLDHDHLAGTLGHFLAILMPLTLVDNKHCGRRVLLLGGIAGMLLSFLCLTACMTMINSKAVPDVHLPKVYQAAYCSLHFSLIFFGIGPGPIPAFMMTELFDTGARATATAICSFFGWFGNAVMFLIFQTITENKTRTTFGCVPFICFLTFAFVFVHFFVPETFGRPVDQVYDEIQSRTWCCCRRADTRMSASAIDDSQLHRGCDK